MATEFRRVTFSGPEIISVIKTGNGNDQARSLKGEITTVLTVRQGGEFYYELVCHDLVTAKNKTLRFSESNIMSAVIGYCEERGIPLPHQARKEVRVIDNAICLDMHLH